MVSDDGFRHWCRIFPFRGIARRSPTSLLPLILPVACVVFGCAKIQAPPGGPEDRTPPEIVGTEPATGAVNVDRAAPVRIEFSEPIIKDKLDEVIYISPRPPTAPEFGGGKKTLEIRWPDSLAANVTCLVTIAAQIADQRRNRLVEPYLLAFSTGPAIDSGNVTGVVFDGDQPAANAQVLLYALPLDSAGAVYTPPDYITEGGPDGAYEFSYLPAGTYRAIAAIDKNKNRTLDIGEKAGVGAFDVSLTADDHRPPPLDLHLQDSDTTRFELSGCSVDQNRILNAVFSHPVDSLSVTSAGWSVKPVNDTVSPPITFVALDSEKKTTVRLLLTDTQIGVSYRLRVTALQDKKGNPLDTLYDTAEFFWPSVPDTTAPTVSRSLPGSGATEVDTDGEFHIWFSEPVDTARAEEGFYAADSAGRRISGTVNWPGPWEMVFLPGSKLAGGTQHLLVLDSGSLVDGAGNSSGSRWATAFTTANPEDFGSIAGDLSVARAEWRDQPVIVEFIPEGRKSRPRSLTLSGSGSFLIDVPAGRYTVRATVDTDGNGRFDPGSVLPFSPAEPRFIFPDLIEVRARFATEGIVLAIP